ncbi:ATP-binding protein [Oligoflexus tunisiensis]|uniref:ATP-binding protein n=1 Tax=Oligoflexus tunisiensis TaxID=708132 RepID=UPI00114CCAE3|nr:ATP-binding protein [Oligoflexus tunisiensis]
MAAAKKKGGNERACFHVALICWALAALGLIWAITFNITIYRSAMLEARDYQKDKANGVARQIHNYCSVATQLADTLTVFVERYEGRDPKQIEQYIDSILESAPREIIYGTGIWWEPYAFDPQSRYFGPYVYRKDPGAERTITYEWSTSRYDYHNQFWYRDGMQAQKEGMAITDPYIDRDVAFISLLKPFYDRKTKGFKGLVSVDLVPPHMARLLENVAIKSSDKAIIVSRTGHLIAHSDSEAVLERVRRRHPQQVFHSIMDVRFADSRVGYEDRLNYSHYMPMMGWTVVIASDPDELLAGYYRSRRVIALATLVYLLTLTIGYFTICYFLQSLERQRENFLYAEKMASLGEMAGSIAHEINNPLAIIQGSAQKLQIRLRHEELNREDLKHTAGVILKTAERIGRIIKSLRFVARDGSTDPFANTSIKTIVEETLALCEARLKNEEIRIDASLIPADLCCVCRAVQISQVLINLINNAVDAIRDLPEKWIRIEARSQKGMIHIAVTDSGPGIPKELADKIMKPFFTTKGVGKGTGLGLSISRGIAHAHGGDLELDADSPHTRFVLTLPQARESLQTA